VKLAITVLDAPLGILLYFNVACLTQWVIKTLCFGALQVACVAQLQRQFYLCCGLMGSGLAPPLFIVLPLFWGALARCKPSQSSFKLPGFLRANSFLPNLCLTCEALDDVFEDISNICHAVIFNLFDILWHRTSLILVIHTWTYDIISLKRHGNTLH
jgi:hypothetical protein